MKYTLLCLLAIGIAVDATTINDCASLKCTKEWIPVCGSDGETYGNGCELQRAQCYNSELTEAHSGPCNSVRTSKRQIDCSEWMCIALWEPVCGSDGKTYSNKCELEIAQCYNSNIKLAHVGECNKPKRNKQIDPDDCDRLLCIASWEPVCGSDGKTYSNECELQMAQCYNSKIQLAHVGECNKPKRSEDCSTLVCPALWSPVCGTDNKTYSNGCELMIANCYSADVKLAHVGECNKPKRSEDCSTLVCPALWSPVCGTDNKTYSNGCELMIANCYSADVKLAHVGECSEAKKRMIEPEDCTSLVCPAIWNPVCANNGKTYSNPCELEIAKCFDKSISLLHSGECKTYYSNEETPKRKFECTPNMKLGLCTKEYEPVCGSNGKTYPNHCMLCAAMYDGNYDLTFISPGLCPKITTPKSYLNPGCNEQVLKIECTEDEFPLCGTDGKTYGNACKFCKGQYQLKNQGFELNVEHLGNCKPLEDETPPELDCRPFETQGFCDKDYKPVCGTDGKTYGNRCALCFAMSTDKNLGFAYLGICKKPEVPSTTEETISEIQCDENSKKGRCTKEYDPVCASDGTTLNNNCLFCWYQYTRQAEGVEVTFKRKGECNVDEYCSEMSKVGACPYTYFPVCANDGNTYPNLCVMCAEMYEKRKQGDANFILRKVFDGVCGFEPPMYYSADICTEEEKNKICSAEEYSPYCGNDGKTYKNKCLFCQEMFKKGDKGEELSVRSDGECPENYKCSAMSIHGACTYIYDPVCGSDGKTYANNCVRCAEMYRRRREGENILIYVKYKGECPNKN